MTAEAFAIGVDVGGTNIRAARISTSGAILQKQKRPTSRDPQEALAAIIELISEMGGSQASAIGIGVPGRVDGRSGAVISGGYLDLSKVALKDSIRAAFGRPVTVLNDCSMALAGEARIGSASGMGNVVMLTIGTGIGGAVMDSGQLLNGARTAGQLGHLVVRQDGQPCLCGQRGCVETESSGSALRRHLREAGYGDRAMFEDVLAEAEAGSARAADVIRAWAEPLRAAIWTLSAAFNPDAVVIGGGMGHAALKALDFLPRPDGWYDVDILAAALGDDAGVIGAALASLEAIGSVSPLCTTGKRLVMVNGVPASGKSSVARNVSKATGWTLLTLDTIKNPFLEFIEGVDRPFNRILGRASYKSIFATIAEAREGTTFVVDAWFGFQPESTLREHLALAGISHLAELWCHAPAEEIGRRYEARAEQRPNGHPGAAYVPELIELARSAKAMALGPVLSIDTTSTLATDKIVEWASAALEERLQHPKHKEATLDEPVAI